LQARHLHVRFQDGVLIDTENADSLPPVLSLDGVEHGSVVVLALPLMRANGGIAQVIEPSGAYFVTPGDVDAKCASLNQQPAQSFSPPVPALPPVASCAEKVL